MCAIFMCAMQAARTGKMNCLAWCFPTAECKPWYGLVVRL